MKKYVLITGVAGLIGSRMADWILENKPEYGVIGVDNLFGGYIDNVDNRVIFYERDLSEEKIEVKKAIPTYQKSIDILGYKENVDLKEMIRDMWEWAKEEPDRLQQKWDSYEITDGLYSYWK